jgi:hypothetical protein
VTLAIALLARGVHSVYNSEEAGDGVGVGTNWNVNAYLPRKGLVNMSLAFVSFDLLRTE